MVINVRNFIGRTLCECLVNVAQMSRKCRETFANDSCDNRTTFVRMSQICLYHTFGVTAMWFWLQCLFLSPKHVSNLSRNSRKSLPSQ